MKRKSILCTLPLLAAVCGIAAVTPAVSSAEDQPDPLVLATTENACISSIVIENKPEKLLYRTGEQIDLSELTVTTSVRVNGNWQPRETGRHLTDSKEFSVTLPDTTKPGAGNIVITYKADGIDAPKVYSGTDEIYVIITGKGDTDVNGRLNADDLRQMNLVLQGKASLSGDAAVNADMNGDGEIDVFDLALMKRNLHETVPEYMQLTPAVHMDLTRDADAEAWETAFQSNKNKTTVNCDTEALEAALSPLRPAVRRALLKPYDDAFFEKNILIFHYDVYDGGEEIQEVSEIAYTDGKLTVATKPQETKYSHQALMLWQIALPREQYNGKPVSWTEQDAEYFKAKLTGYHVDPPNDEIPEEFRKGVLVMNAEEEAALLERIYSDEVQQRYATADMQPMLSTQARFYHIVPSGMGVSSRLWQTRRVGNRIIADISSTVPTAMSVRPVWALECLTFPAHYAEGQPEFVFHDVTGGSYFDTDGAQYYFQSPLPDTPDLAINPYHFGGEYEIAFYWRDYTGSMQTEFRLIASEAVSADASKIHDRDSGNAKILKDDAEGFSIEWSDTGVTVTFLKSKADGKPTLLHFPYPQQ